MNLSTLFARIDELNVGAKMLQIIQVRSKKFRAIRTYAEFR